MCFNGFYWVLSNGLYDLVGTLVSLRHACFANGTTNKIQQQMAIDFLEIHIVVWQINENVFSSIRYIMYPFMMVFHGFVYLDVDCDLYRLLSKVKWIRRIVVLGLMLGSNVSACFFCLSCRKKLAAKKTIGKHVFSFFLCRHHVAKEWCALMLNQIQISKKPTKGKL